MNQTKDELLELGNKLTSLGEKTSPLVSVDSSREFAKMAKELDRQQKGGLCGHTFNPDGGPFAWRQLPLQIRKCDVVDRWTRKGELREIRREKSWKSDEDNHL
jgi:hypothetical protein